jgi:excisionase family DNA binding protein
MEANKTERLTMTVEEAGVALGISRATAYMLVNTGRIPAIRISERRLIVPRAALLRVLESAGKPKE